MDINAFRAVFFDWDGTLVDSFKFLHSAHNHVRKQLGIEPFTLEVFGQYFGQPREQLYKELYGDNMEEAKRHFKDYVLANHINDLKALDGAEALLEHLHSTEVMCGVVTNKQGDLVKKEIENFGWGKYFTTIVGAAEAEADKPSPAPLLLAIERAGLTCSREEILFVGDTDNDVLCANGAECPCVFIEDIEEYEKLSATMQIDYHFSNIRSFLDLLLQSGANSIKNKTIG